MRGRRQDCVADERPRGCGQVQEHEITCTERAPVRLVCVDSPHLRPQQTVGIRVVDEVEDVMRHHASPSDSSWARAARNARSSSSFDTGNCGSMSTSACTSTAPAAMRVTHLLSTGTAYHSNH